MSKGSWKRPCSLTEEKMDEVWNRVFGERRLPTIMEDNESERFRAEKAKLAREIEGPEHRPDAVSDLRGTADREDV